MRLHHLAACVTLIVTGMGSVQAAQPIAPDSTGLSKGSVFDIPPPKVYQYAGKQPGENTVLPRAYLNAPPQIPHDISDLLPITAQNNFCIACHSQPPANWDKKREPGTPTPIPRSHFTDLRNAPGKVSSHLINSRYNCNQCHAPQANAAPLVGNTFSSKQ